MTPSSPRALIVSDNALSASTIRRSLRDASIRDVIGYVDAGRACAAQIAEVIPDVVIVDETRSAGDALARIAEVRAAQAAVKIVLLTSSMEPAWLAQASAAGVDAAIHKSRAALSVGALVREVVAGNIFHTFVPARVHVEAPMPSCLTSRELEILRLVAAGTPNGEIGAQLWIAEQTVKYHLSNVYRKLGVANRTQASSYAHRYGLLETTGAARIAATVAA
jgi:DNA-binding NarL/FixJ family response regulator